MAHDTEDHSRLLMEIGRKIKTLNKEIIDPMIPELTLEQLTPVIKIVAQIRGAYLKELFDILYQF